MISIITILLSITLGLLLISEIRYRDTFGRPPVTRRMVYHEILKQTRQKTLDE